MINSLPALPGFLIIAFIDLLPGFLLSDQRDHLYDLAGYL
jgi:hypothetical protein